MRDARSCADNCGAAVVPQALPLEDVEQLMQDGADAKAYEDSLRQLLGGCKKQMRAACLVLRL